MKGITIFLKKKSKKLRYGRERYKNLSEGKKKPFDYKFFLKYGKKDASNKKLFSSGKFSFRETIRKFCRVSIRNFFKI